MTAFFLLERGKETGEEGGDADGYARATLRLRETCDDFRHVQTHGAAILLAKPRSHAVHFIGQGE